MIVYADQLQAGDFACGVDGELIHLTNVAIDETVDRVIALGHDLFSGGVTILPPFTLTNLVEIFDVSY